MKKQRLLWDGFRTLPNREKAKKTDVLSHQWSSGFLEKTKKMVAELERLKVLPKGKIK